MIVTNMNNNFNNTNEYYIKKLDETGNAKWDKKYFDATYIKSEISYNDSKMLLKFRINIASRSNLPMGTLLVDINLPGMEIRNVPIYNTFERPIENIKEYPNWICNIYEGNIEIDLANNKYFHREIFKENIKINFKFNIDIETFNNNKIVYDNESLSMLFYELKTKNIELNFTYSNSVKILNSGNFLFPIKNYFDSNGNKENENVKINFNLPKNFDNNFIFNLFGIKTNYKNIFINGFKIDLVYKIGNEYKKILIHQKENIMLEKSYDMNLKIGYAYDYLSNSFIEDSNINGIFFPFKSLGFYNVKFNIIFFGKNYLINLKNNFNLENNDWIIVEKENSEFNDYEQIK